MRAFVPLLPVMILGFALPAFADPTTEPAQREFISRENKLRLKYPAEWVLSEPSPGEVFAARADHALISLRVDQGPKDSSDDAILINLADEIAAFIFKTGGEHVTIKPEKLTEIPARRISFEKNNPTERIKVVYIVAVKDRVEYVFNFKGPAAAFDSLLPAFSEMLKSFEVLD